MIYYAPVLPAEGWTSIDRYRESYEMALKKYAPHLDTTSLLPTDSVNVNKWKKRVIRDIIYPREIRRQTNIGDSRNVVHIFDHAYAHLCKSAGNSILHCHDLNHFVEPSLTGLQLKRWKARVMGMKNADRIIAISEQLSGEIQQYIGIPEEKISVVYNGLDHESFRPGMRATAVERFPELARCQAEGRFLLLNVGTNLDRKNLETVYAAVKELHERGRKVTLVRVGTNASRDGEQKRITEYGIADDVIQMGVRTTEEVALLYNLCDTLSFASLYEGFGWPLVEAQACGLPVIAANCSCIPEIAGQGALYHVPKDVIGLVEAVEALNSIPQAKEELVEKGFQNAARFSWERHVTDLIRVYNSLRG